MSNPIITKDFVTDIPDAFHVADPFVVYDGSQWVMFFEVFIDHGGGDTTAWHAYATSPDKVTWTYGSKLNRDGLGYSEGAYPQVINVDGNWFMAPHDLDRDLVLYKCTRWPDTWVTWRTLFTSAEGRIGDGTLFQWDGKFYCLVGRRSPYYDTYLYWSNTLDGDVWNLHPASPIITGIANWRPGGRPIIREGVGVDVFLQDESVTYGGSLKIYRLTNLTPTTCTITELETSPIIGASGVAGSWNEHGMHTCDRVDSTLTVVDGKKIVDGVDVWSIGIYRDVI